MEDRSAIILEVRPTVYQPDMELCVGWDYKDGEEENEELILRFLYHSDVISKRPRELGGQLTFNQMFQKSLGHGWGDPPAPCDPDSVDRKFYATYSIHVQPLIRAGEKLLLRDPVEGCPAKEVTRVDDDRLFVVKLFLANSIRRRGIVFD